MSKVNLFKKLTVTAITAAMCLGLTLSASANAGEGFKADSADISVMKTERTDTYSFYFSALQPYFDELQKINDEFGYGIALCTSTEDDVAWLYSEYCSMSIPEFRDYIIDLYNANYVHYDVPDINVCTTTPVTVTAIQDSQNGALATQATTYTAYQYLYADESKPDNYFRVKSSMYNKTSGGKIIKRYDSVDELLYHTVDFPTWKTTLYTYEIDEYNDRYANFNIEVTWYLTPKSYIKASVTSFDKTLDANTSSYNLNLPDWE